MTGLLDVAEHLSEKARKEVGARADAFGRSAFNRYYYASFLSVRELLAEIAPDLAKRRHAELPSLLQKDVLSEVRKAANNSAKSGAITLCQSKSFVHQAASATSEIANVLHVANQARKIADYNPQIAVEFDFNGFSLEGQTDAAAREWKGRIDRMRGVLLNVFRELAIV